MPSMLLLLTCPCFCLLWVLQWWFWSHFLQGHMGNLWRHRFLNHLGDTLWMILCKAMLDSVFSKSSRKCENSWSAEWILSLTVCYSLQVVGVSPLWGSLSSLFSVVWDVLPSAELFFLWHQSLRSLRYTMPSEFPSLFQVPMQKIQYMFIYLFIVWAVVK